MGYQLGELQEPHFRRKFGQEACISKTKYFFLVWWIRDSVRREVLYKILIEFGIPRKLVRL